MFENEWFPQANAMGVTWQEFWGMNPHIIKCLIKGHNEKIEQEAKRQDYLQYLWWGKYGISAVGFAVEHCLAGRKAKSKYADKPILREIEERNKPMSEKELQKQRELFVAKLEVMKMNFELNNKQNEVKV